MLISPQFMDAVGSGMDQNDASCMAGRAFYNQHMIALTTYDQCVAKANELLLTASEQDASLIRRWLKWGEKITRSPAALRAGGNSRMLSRYLARGVGFSEECASYDEARELCRANVYAKRKSVKIFGVLRESGRVKTVEVGRDMIDRFEELMVATSKGQTVSATPGQVDQTLLDLETAEKVRRGAHARIYRKIVDEVHGYEAWDEIEHGYP